METVKQRTLYVHGPISYKHFRQKIDGDIPKPRTLALPIEEGSE